jgi:hypothetical protein
MRPARIELATSSSAGQTAGWTGVEADDETWLYKPRLGSSARHGRHHENALHALDGNQRRRVGLDAGEPTADMTARNPPSTRTR